MSWAKWDAEHRGQGVRVTKSATGGSKVTSGGKHLGNIEQRGGKHVAVTKGAGGLKSKEFDSHEEALNHIRQAHGLSATSASQHASGLKHDDTGPKPGESSEAHMKRILDEAHSIRNNRESTPDDHKRAAALFRRAAEGRKDDPTYHRLFSGFADISEMKARGASQKELHDYAAARTKETNDRIKSERDAAKAKKAEEQKGMTASEKAGYDAAKVGPTRPTKGDTLAFERNGKTMVGYHDGYGAKGKTRVTVLSKKGFTGSKSFLVPNGQLRRPKSGERAFSTLDGLMPSHPHDA